MNIDTILNKIDNDEKITYSESRYLIRNYKFRPEEYSNGFERMRVYIKILDRYFCIYLKLMGSGGEVLKIQEVKYTPKIIDDWETIFNV